MDFRILTLITFSCFFLIACGGSGGSAPAAQSDTQSQEDRPTVPPELKPVAGIHASSNYLNEYEVGESYRISATVYSSSQPIISYEWTLSTKPAGSSLFINDTNASSVEFVPDVAGEYRFTLRVFDGAQYSDTVSLNVEVMDYTKIGGIYSEDTVLTFADSPYKITETIQIAYGTTFTVEAGVEIYGWGSIHAYGKLIVSGIEEDRVLLQNLRILNKGSSSEHSGIEISYALIRGGSLLPATGNSSYGYLHLRDSILLDVADKTYPIPDGSSSFSSADYAYLWYPTEDCYIERNVFDNSGAISAGTRLSDAYIFIRNNVFVNSEKYYLVQNWASYDGNAVWVEGNSFLDAPQRMADGKQVLTIGTENDSMYAVGNYWGGLTDEEIPDVIYDRNDSLSAGMYIDYLPTLTEPAPQTPVYEGR